MISKRIKFVIAFCVCLTFVATGLFALRNEVRRRHFRRVAAAFDRNYVETLSKEMAQEKSIEELIALLRSKDLHTTSAAQEALIRKGPSATDYLIKALKQRDVNVASRAASVLGMTGGEEAVKPLIEALKYPKIRVFTAQSLGELGDRRAIEPLKKLFEKERRPSERGAILNSLCLLMGSEAMDFVIKAMNDRHAWVRRRAFVRVYGFSTYGYSLEGVPDLEALVIEGLADPDPEVRWAAVYALGEVGNSSLCVKFQRYL